MVGEPQLQVNTASPAQSIWRNVDRNTFREHIVALQHTCNRKPGDPKVHSASDWQVQNVASSGINNILPFDVEQRLADDLAFIAANENSVQAISAVALEEHVEPHGVTFVLAANKMISLEVPGAFECIFGLLSQCASKKLSRDSCVNSLFDQVMVLSHRRIRNRLQAAVSDRPLGLGGRSYEPLHKELRKFCHELGQHRSNVVSTGDMVRQLEDLCPMLQEAHDCGRDKPKEIELMRTLVQRSYNICTSGGKSTIEQTILNNGLEPRKVCPETSIRQIDKLGRYWGLCRSMAEDARCYRSLFTNIRLEVLPPFRSAKSLITFDRGARATLYVHAEMQILVHYSLISNVAKPKPRTIGVSKSACYLCNLFIHAHGEYFITKTHGELFDSWNLPNLAEYGTSQRSKLRGTLTAVDQELRFATAREKKNPRFRPQPMGSWLSLPVAHPLSPVPSTAVTSESEEKRTGASFHTSGSLTPRTQSNASPIRSTSVLSDIAEAEADSSGRRTPAGHSLTQTPAPNTLSTMPPSSPKPVATAAKPEDIPRDSTPTPLSRPRGIASPTISLVSSPLPSPSSILSWEYPVNRTIESTKPLRLRAGKVSTTFEIEDPAQGLVAIESTTDEEPRREASIDVNRMKPGEEIHFYRESRDDSIVLNLQYSPECSTQATLKWL